MTNEADLGGRFSAQEFERRGLDTEESALLALELEQAVGRRVFQKLKQAAEAIVRELNAEGHALTLDDEQTDDPLLPIGLSFRDQSVGPNGEARCKLRLAFDLTVSAGYAHLQDDLDEARALSALGRAE